MPKDLPGFYYDAEKNRYFPYKGPIPGSSQKPNSKPQPSDKKQAGNVSKCVKIRNNKLLQERELCGNIISSRSGKLSFQSEYERRHASRPLIWKYKDTPKMGNIALEYAVTDVSSPNGLIEKDFLLSGGVNGLLCLYEVGKAGQEIVSDNRYKIDYAWTWNQDRVARHKELTRQLGISTAQTYMRSDISCIKSTRKRSIPTDNTASKHFMITTLGSDNAPGSVFLLDLSKPLHFGTHVPIVGTYQLAAFNQTLWTIDCDTEGRRAVIGTNRGAMLLNIETGSSSRVFHCKSDLLSVQIDQSGNSIICGLRNGAIVSVDTRQKQIKRDLRSSSTISVMPSSVCCLASLKLHDQYFLASSMDGSIKLYDHRLMRGAVQCYEGNVNSHTRIDLGVDPSEKVFMSGGEDCYLRLWNIKSGELIFKDKFTDSVPSAVCWPRITGRSSSQKVVEQDYGCYWEDHYCGAWIGSYEGIFYMDWL